MDNSLNIEKETLVNGINSMSEKNTSSEIDASVPKDKSYKFDLGQ